MMVAPPVVAVGFCVVGVRRGRFTPIAAGAILLFIVGAATPIIAVS